MGGLVLLNMDMITVKVHCEIELRHIGIVEPVAADIFIFSPFTQRAQILSKAIGEHPGLFTNLQVKDGFGRFIHDPSGEAFLSDIEVQQTAFDVAIIEVVGLYCPQAHLLAKLGVAREHGCPPPPELLPQTLSHRRVEGTEILFFSQALTVWGVDHDQPFSVTHCRRYGHRTEVAAFDVYPLVKACPLKVIQSRPDSRPVEIVTQDYRQLFETLLHTVAGLYLKVCPDTSLVILPPNETERRSEDPGRDIASYKSRFDRQGPRSAHGIDERKAFRGQCRPSNSHENGRGKVLLKRGLSLFMAVAPPVQRVSRQVQAYSTQLPGQVKVEPDIRLLDVDGGAAAEKVPKPVHNGILYLQGCEMSVIDRPGFPARVYREGRVR